MLYQLFKTSLRICKYKGKKEKGKGNKEKVKMNNEKGIMKERG